MTTYERWNSALYGINSRGSDTPIVEPTLIPVGWFPYSKFKNQLGLVKSYIVSQCKHVAHVTASRTCNIVF